MPIEFGCECGKEFSVADTFAGKRTKCPACGVALTVPTPEEPIAPPKRKVDDEDDDAAYQLLADAPDAEPEPKRPPQAPTRSTLAVSSDGTPARRRKSRDPDDYEYERPRIHLSNGFWWAIATMGVAVIWFVIALSNGRLFFYPPVLFVMAMITAIKEVCGHPDD